MEFTSLIGKRLESVWIWPNPVYQAWIDKHTPAITSGPVCLRFADGTVADILPCEVEMPNQYPPLGIEMQDSAMPMPELYGKRQRVNEADAFLPANISDYRLSDTLGEGQVSAISLVLSTGVTITVRHIYPPMTLGVDLPART